MLKRSPTWSYILSSRSSNCCCSSLENASKKSLSSKMPFSSIIANTGISLTSTFAFNWLAFLSSNSFSKGSTKRSVITASPAA